jgi:uncharacterized membrane protein YccC
MTTITEKDLGDVITNLVSGFQQELYQKSKEQLKSEWYWKWDAKKSIERNLYEFTDMLDLHRDMARRWEEHHNGSCCVVERVRDEYLMPRIREFLDQMKNAVADLPDC